MSNETVENDPRPIYLVTGATGYVGGRLIRELVQRGLRVRALARHPDRLRDFPWVDQIEIAAGDAGDPESLSAAMQGVSVAYYLLHSLQEGKELEFEESRIAENFAQCAKEAKIKRIVYLGGLAPDLPITEMSPHMRSRVAVGRILHDSGIPTIELRAAVIIGSGSASFEMLRYLTERLPAMITPRWVRTQTQPIAVRDVLRYLVLSAELPAEVSRSFDIGGPDVLAYQDMMQRYAKVAGLPRRLILPINILTPKLSSHWVGLVTPVPRAIARPLVLSLRYPAVCLDSDIKNFIPDPPEGLLPFDQSVALALTRIQDAQVTTRWSSASTPGVPSQPLPSDPDWAGGTLYEDIQVLNSQATPQELWAAVDCIGGDNGWYSAKLLWEVRGFIDRLVGGVGLRRGRRDPNVLHVGETVDFWRVEERQAPELLRLRAEMKMPGRAWLEFSVTEGKNGGSTLTQRAVYWPKSLTGHVYWWSVAPFHAFVFPPMAKHIVERAESKPALTKSGS